MNSSRTSLPQIRTQNTRAHLSPLRRRATLDAKAVQPRDGRAPAALKTARLYRLEPVASLPPALERWWTPHLLDRLQAPLTRYHD